MKKIVGIFLCLFLATTCRSYGIVGDWGGPVKYGDKALQIVLHVRVTDSVYTVTLDVPDQWIYGLPASVAEYRDSLLFVKWDKLNVTFTGKTVGNELQGTLRENSVEVAVALKRGKYPDYTQRRPQEPKPPFPYRSEEVNIYNAKDSVTLAGTLTLPEGKGPFPAVVLVTGSGQQNRDEELMGHKPFAVIADYLTRRGIAVLRYDDRGVGQSTGNFGLATSANFALDALAVFDYLASRPEVASNKVGIVGHSEGGTIVFMAAAQNPEVAFVVSLAGAATRGDSILLKQNKALLAPSTPDSTANAYVDVIRDIFRLQESYPVEYLRTHSDSLAKELFPAGSRGSLPGSMRLNAMILLTTPEGMWMRYFKQNDPKPYILATRCPVLAINGTKDVQVDAAINLGLIERYAAESGNKRVTAKAYDGLNHLFQHAVTGSPNEYAQIGETISPEVLADIADWILQTAR